MVIKLRSKRLAHLFTEVWQHLPEADRTLLASRTRLVIDNPNFLPTGQIPTWGAAMSIRVHKSISIVYLSPRKLPRQSDDFVRYVIAHELGHIFCGHLEQVAFSESFAAAADKQVSLWGFCIVSPI